MKKVKKELKTHYDTQSFELEPKWNFVLEETEGLGKSGNVFPSQNFV